LADALTEFARACGSPPSFAATRRGTCPVVVRKAARFSATGEVPSGASRVCVAEYVAFADDAEKAPATKPKSVSATMINHHWRSALRYSTGSTVYSDVFRVPQE
jgi:hypothetical protein